MNKKNKYYNLLSNIFYYNFIIFYNNSIFLFIFAEETVTKKLANNLSLSSDIIRKETDALEDQFLNNRKIVIHLMDLEQNQQDLKHHLAVRVLNQ